MLMRAISAGDVEAVEVFLRYGANPNETDQDGFTPLMKACALSARQKFALDKCTERTAKIVEECINSDETARTTLNAIKNSPAIVKLLLDYGADVNARDNVYNMTALSYASQNINPYCFLKAMEKKFKFARYIIFTDSLRHFKNYHRNEIRKADKDSFMIISNSRIMPDIHEIFSDSEIMFIPVEPSEEASKVVRLLINSGAYVDQNILRSAVEDHSHRGVIGALIEAGCGISGIDLEYAIQHDSPELVHALLMNRADPEAMCKEEDKRLIFYAAENASAEVVRELILFGVYIDTTTESGMTPLISAAAHNTLSVVEMLISEGADVNAKTTWGATALITASQESHQGIARALLEAGANPNVRINDNGLTALLTAAWGNNLGCSYGIIKELLKFGADPDARDRDENRNALQFMELNPDRSPEMEKLLTEAGTDVNSTNENSNFYQD